jgi:hypothetical protein
MMRLQQAFIEFYGGFLSTYYKYIISAIPHKINVFGHILIRLYCPALACGTPVQSVSIPFHLHSAYFTQSPEFKRSMRKQIIHEEPLGFKVIILMYYRKTFVVYKRMYIV